ncbi:MAG: hypothetical protein CVU39_17265 [Chloroflexi bacterium HGW-Chloroflexi-10]|nr:MAG: hypothetical protein CVU39_17265 [Chloroflexi bacterium HGW-Chloroflexi-10]
MKNKKISNKTLLNLTIDVLFLVAFLVVIDANATGIAIHEWLGMGIVGVILIHVLLHWDWVVKVTKRFFTRLRAEPRINYLLDMAIMIGFVTIIFSGLMISESVLPAIGLQGSREAIWKFLHYQATDITILLVGAHLALHYKWILTVIKRYAISPIAGLFHRKPKTQIHIPDGFPIKQSH